MSSNTSLNPSGLSAEVTRKLATRQPAEHEKPILQGIREMYSCKPTATTFDIYTPDAVFHDPVGLAEGLSSIKAQFVGLTKLFPRADIPKFRVLENPPEVPKSTILVDQDVSYFRKEDGNSPTKTLNSLLVLRTNEQHKVTHHFENWNHEKTTSSEDGFFGMLNEQRKRLTAKLTDAAVKT